MIAIIAAVVAALLLLLLFMRLYPPLGGKPSPQARETIVRSANYGGKKFVNPVPTAMVTTTSEKMSMLIDFVKGNPNGKPSRPLAMSAWTPLRERDRDRSQVRVTWLGHSASIVEMAGLTLLLDPMLGRAPSPLPMIGSKRFSRGLPLDVDRLTSIDAVILSHDHYDHLDYPTVKRIKHKVKRFIVPLGVGAHLQRWGVSAEAISEHDWWDELEYAGLRLTCAPARHFSGRSVTDRDATLWCSWVIDSGALKLFFSGDSGYGPHFKEIGTKYGPFDVTLMECGQYDERWSAIHMMPEQTAQAQADVGGKLMIPIHWGAFTLALHDWTDPVERLLVAADRLGLVVATPKIGEPVDVQAEPGEIAETKTSVPDEKWWRS